MDYSTRRSRYPNDPTAVRDDRRFVYGCAPAPRIRTRIADLTGGPRLRVGCPVWAPASAHPVAEPGGDLRDRVPQRALQPVYHRFDGGVPDGQVDGDVDRRDHP